MSNLLLGTSGWSYSEWVGSMYQTKTTPKLRKYCTIFKSVEIDSTFYAYPRKETVQGWIRNSPPGFKFSAKIPRLITHEKKLKSVKKEIDEFLTLLKPMQDARKLGSLLIQLPPSFRSDSEKTLEDFLSILPLDFKFAVEFRDKSWEGKEKVLSRYKVANVVTDSPLELTTEQTADWSYVRYHGRGDRIWFDYKYSEDEIRKLYSRLKELEDTSNVVYGYFNNHYGANAVDNALQLLQMDGTPTPSQLELLNQFRMKKDLDSYM